MSEQEVIRIAQNVYRENDKINNALIRLIPMLNTKDACQLLSCNRRWLYENKHKFGAVTVNRRGDLNFSTTKIVEYKKKLKIY